MSTKCQSQLKWWRGTNRDIFIYGFSWLFHSLVEGKWKSFHLISRPRLPTTLACLNLSGSPPSPPPSSLTPCPQPPPQTSTSCLWWCLALLVPRWLRKRITKFLKLRKFFWDWNKYQTFILTMTLLICWSRRLACTTPKKWYIFLIFLLVMPTY